MNKRNIWIALVAVVLVLAVAAGAFIVPRLPGDEVAVFSVSMVGYTDYYSGSAESYGMVTTDKVQALYVSGTQTVTEILVYPGQEVKKGDVLYTYDTTLSDLAVERKDLANQQLEVELKTAKAELDTLKKMKPIVYKPGSGSSASTKTDFTKSPAQKAKLGTVYSTTTSGLTSTKPLYFWLSKSAQVDEKLIDTLFDEATGNPRRIYVVFQTSPGDKTGTTFDSHVGVSFIKVYETAPTEPTDPPTTPTTPTEPSETTEPTESTAPSETTEPTESTAPSETTEPTEAAPPSESTEPTEAAPPSDPSEPSGESSEVGGDPEAPVKDPETPGGDSEAPVSDPLPAPAQVFAGYKMTFFDPPSAPVEDNGTIQWNDGYTSAELSAMKSEKQAQIKQLEFDIKMGKAELKIMQKEAADGNVVANFDGVVSEILEPADALVTGEPLMKVTGGGGYYVEGTVSELALSTIRVGQTVTVNSWDTGAVYDGTIVEIGAYPAEDQGYYYGSSNTTFYPYKVFIDESANLQEGYYVSMTYQSAEQAAGTLYLQNAFLRSEGNRSYVYARNAEGLLEKRYLECGVSTDGYMTPVYSGITEEDFLAFPYGKSVKEGAVTYEGTDQDLYGY